MINMPDFEEWLAAHEPEGHDEIIDLWRAANERETNGMWKVTTKDTALCEKTFIAGPEGTMELLSEKRV
jgi:hypothetical protein